jgi:hypothetical protein
VAILEIGHSFVQRLGTLGRHLVTEEGDIGRPKDALRRVGDNPIPLKVVEECPQVLFEGLGEDEDVTQVCETEV